MRAEQVLLWVWGRAEHRLAPPAHPAGAASSGPRAAPLHIACIEEGCESEALGAMESPCSSKQRPGSIRSGMPGEGGNRQGSEFGVPATLGAPGTSRPSPSSPGTQDPDQGPALLPAPHGTGLGCTAAAAEAGERCAAPYAQPAPQRRSASSGSQDGGCIARYGLIEAQARSLFGLEPGRGGELPLAALDPSAILHVGLLPLWGAACLGAAARDVRQVQALWVRCAQNATLGYLEGGRFL